MRTFSSIFFYQKKKHKIKKKSWRRYFQLSIIRPTRPTIFRVEIRLRGRMNF